MAGNGTKWLDDPTDLYIISHDGSVEGFRKPDGEMATTQDLQEDAKRWRWNFAAAA